MCKIFIFLCTFKRLTLDRIALSHRQRLVQQRALLLRNSISPKRSPTSSRPSFCWATCSGCVILHITLLLYSLKLFLALILGTWQRSCRQAAYIPCHDGGVYPFPPWASPRSQHRDSPCHSIPFWILCRRSTDQLRWYVLLLALHDVTHDMKYLGVIADIWPAVGRGPATSLFTASVFLGPVLGPIVAG
jgi:hypothetical protein